MTTGPTPSPDAARLKRTYDAPAELIWELCTAAGLGEWSARAHRGNEPGNLEAWCRLRKQARRQR
jgi:hypothetical protein